MLQLWEKTNTYYEGTSQKHALEKKSWDDLVHVIWRLGRKLCIDFSYCSDIFQYLRPWSYNRSALLFVRKDLRDPTMVAFSFARYIDDLVDEIRLYLGDETTNKLQELHQDRQCSRDTNFSHHPIINSMRYVVNTYAIPEELIELFFQAMFTDLKEDEIETYDEGLKTYMYNWSSSLAMIMLHIFNIKGPHALKLAETIGYAMHLTNILKDIKKDYSIGILYLPKDLLEKYNLEKESIPHIQDADEWVSLMKELISKARWYYSDVQDTMHCLPKDVIPMTQLVVDIYSSFLDEIEDNHYDVFSQTPKISSYKKIKLIARSVIGWLISK